ncbi:unnamed protein product [Lymnaea stagnalis]|uniref:Uncharacterized protein n=1 Tax=Lymnaea stagnalis TaxID=6523 RepID=A0AAV2IG71_LYMST
MRDMINSFSGGDRPVKVYYVNKGAEFGDLPPHKTDTYELPHKSPQKSDDDKTVKSQEDTIEIHVYKRRWYILAVYSLFAFTQALIWNTWGPIATTSEEAFGWSDANVAWLTNWGPVSFVLVGFLFPWILQVKGVRWAVVPSAFLIALGTCCRVITSETEAATILIHIGQFFNGLAGPMAMSGISSVSSSWFPPHERVTATAIGVSTCYFGAAIAFVVGPTLVSLEPRLDPNATTLTPTINVSSSSYDAVYSSHLTPASSVISNVSMTNDSIDAIRMKQAKEQIMNYMYYECGWACLIFLLTAIYFPSKPHRPPSTSASTTREDYWAGLWSLRHKSHFILLATVYGISTGVTNCWATVLNVNLNPYGVSENKSGWLGFYATVASCACALFVGRFGDLFASRMKACILFFFIIGCGCYTVFALMLIDVIPFSDAVLYSSVIGGNVLINGAIPMIYELGCELAYPTSEGAANGLLTLLNNIGGLLFLAVFSFPNIGTMWTNWTAIGSIAVCIPLIIMLKGRFNRLEVDEGINPELYADQELEVATDQESKH